MEVTYLPDYFINSLCRLCAEKSTKLTPIIDNKSLFLKINKCLPIQINVSDNLPVNICDKCEIKVDETYLLHETCISAEQKLKWLLNNFLKPKEAQMDGSNSIMQSVVVLNDGVQHVEAPKVIVTLPEDVFIAEQSNKVVNDFTEGNEKNVS